MYRPGCAQTTVRKFRLDRIPRLGGETVTSGGGVPLCRLLSHD